MKSPLLIVCLALASCVAPPQLPPAPCAVGITVNGKPFTVREGATVIYRDARTGRMTPLSVVNP